MNSGCSSSSSDAKRLAGKVALITGAARGIGYATAALFHQHGAKVIIADILDEVGQNAAHQINPSKDHVIYVHCDITKEEDVCNAVDMAVAKYGKLDIMFNNAAIIGRLSKSVLDFSTTDFAEILEVNLLGQFLGAKHAARVMMPVGKGCIIFNGSASTVTGGLCDHAYCAAKHGLEGLTKNMAVELGKFGIRVNCVSPFAVHTPLVTDYLEGRPLYDEVMSKCINLKGGYLQEKDVAEAALYLASDESRYVSGHNLVVDGGFTICDSAFNVFKV